MNGGRCQHAPCSLVVVRRPPLLTALPACNLPCRPVCVACVQAVREGTWWSKPAADGGAAAADGGLDSAASLQDLASCIMGEPQQAAAATSGSPGKAGFSSSEEQAQYFELEREVAEMQAMLEEATAAAAVEAAAGGNASKTNTQYLTEILGACTAAWTDRGHRWVGVSCACVATIADERGVGLYEQSNGGDVSSRRLPLLMCLVLSACVRTMLPRSCRPGAGAGGRPCACNVSAAES